MSLHKEHKGRENHLSDGRHSKQATVGGPPSSCHSLKEGEGLVIGRVPSQLTDDKESHL